MYEIFAKLLEKNHLKAADVCRGTGLPSSLFSEWKKGKSTPKADKLKKIADYFGVTINYLMTGSDDSEKVESLSVKEARDIALDLKSAIEKLDNGESVPAVFEGIMLTPAKQKFLAEQLNTMYKYLKESNKDKK